MTSRPLRVLANHEMASLDPGNWLSDSSSAFVILKLVCPSLVRLDPQMNIEPDLAESWSVAPDCRSFRFKLRRGVVMHSGRPLTADLVIWNFRRIMDSRTGSLLASDYAGLHEVRRDSDDGVVVEFDKPFPAFLHHLAWRTYIVDDCAMQPSTI
jgi:peptide/nickel transport system substrate-binding protein